MAIIKWEPYRRTLTPLRGWFEWSNQMSQLMDNIFGESAESDVVAWGPAVDIAENDDNYQIVAELPGIRMDEVKISLENNVLTIRGEKRHEVTENKRNYRRIERCYGQFQRSFTLPSSVNAEEVKAEMDNGVLTITLPKAEEAKAREIPIKGK
ncbi:MAG: Hsp20/alpha crystallin family protein [Calditrichaeota bacterium]|nr:Hsp20/alpha crystallin family protein [Calditrichota bacterium]